MCTSLPHFTFSNTESRMASTFQLGDEQPAMKPTTNLTKSSNNSFNNLFGPPTPAKVAPAGPMSGKMPTAAPSGLVGEVDKASLVKRSRKPLPVDPLTGQVIGDQTKRVEVRRKVKKNSKLQKLSRFGRRRPPSQKDHLVETTASSGDWLCR